MAFVIFWSNVIAIVVIGVGVLYSIAKDLLTGDR